MFEIKLDNQPKKFLKNCEDVLFDRITAALKNLRQNPVPHDAKHIVGYALSTFRVRIGKWRILYWINYSTNIVVVVLIEHRERVY